MSRISYVYVGAGLCRSRITAPAANRVRIGSVRDRVAAEVFSRITKPAATIVGVRVELGVRCWLEELLWFADGAEDVGDAIYVAITYKYYRERR